MAKQIKNSNKALAIATLKETNYFLIDKITQDNRRGGIDIVEIILLGIQFFTLNKIKNLFEVVVIIYV